MIEIDGRTYQVSVTEVGLDVEFVYKFAERAENYEMQYELGAVFYNQSLTFGLENSKNEDFLALFRLLSTKSGIDQGTGHQVVVWTPIGKLPFLMYPDKLSLSMVMDEHSKNTTWWSGFTVNFIAVKPAESW